MSQVCNNNVIIKHPLLFRDIIKNTMKITVAKSAGFCFGVKRALQIARNAAATTKNVYMLGDIVHNETVVRSIMDSGIKKTGRITKGSDKTLLIRAHGAPSSVYEKAKKAGNLLIDATCPMVKEIHRLASRAEKDGYPVIVIGDKKHDEVRGILGQLTKKALVIDSVNSIPLARIKKLDKAAIVVQSTQNIDKVLTIVDTLEKHIKDLKFFNTICLPTKTKQDEIRKMPLSNDVLIVIGSKTSANTKRLYEISHSLNKKSYWIQSEEEIVPSWFKGAKTVGITAGASTPDATTRAVVSRIKHLTNHSHS